MTSPTATAEIERLAREAPAGPWRYRPNEHDDWGQVRDAAGETVAWGRGTPDMDSWPEHRRAGTDPFAEGREAHDAGQPETANPYDIELDDTAHLAWNDGWYAAAEDALEDGDD